LISEEAKALPGGFVAIALFWLGGGSLFVSVLLIALNAGSPGFLDGMQANWLIVRVWGLVAVALAVLMRQGGSRTALIIGAIWLLLALVSFLAAELGLMAPPFA